MPNRAAMDAILLVLRTGMQWNALDGTGLCSCSSACRRFLAWIEADIFEAFWRLGLLEYDELKGIDWTWLATGWRDDESTAGREKIGPNPCDRAKGGVKRRTLTEAAGIPLAVEVAPAPANRHDTKLVAATLAGMMCARPVDDRSGSAWIWLTTTTTCGSLFALLDSSLLFWVEVTSGRTKSSAAPVRTAGWLKVGTLRGDCSAGRGSDKLLAFSCKRRGFCPLCSARCLTHDAASAGPRWAQDRRTPWRRRHADPALWLRRQPNEAAIVRPLKTVIKDHRLITPTASST